MSETKASFERAVTDMIMRLQLPESSRGYIRMMLIGSYQLGRDDQKKTIMGVLETHEQVPIQIPISLH